MNAAKSKLHIYFIGSLLLHVCGVLSDIFSVLIKGKLKLLVLNMTEM